MWKLVLEVWIGSRMGSFVLFWFFDILVNPSIEIFFYEAYKNTIHFCHLLFFMVLFFDN